MVNTKKIKVGIIGFGRMGNKYLTQLLKNGRYDVTYIFFVFTIRSCF